MFTSWNINVIISTKTNVNISANKCINVIMSLKCKQEHECDYEFELEIRFSSKKTVDCETSWRSIIKRRFSSYLANITESYSENVLYCKHDVIREHRIAAGVWQVSHTGPSVVPSYETCSIWNFQGERSWSITWKTAPGDWRQLLNRLY